MRTWHAPACDAGRRDTHVLPPGVFRVPRHGSLLRRGTAAAAMFGRRATQSGVVGATQRAPLGTQPQQRIRPGEDRCSVPKDGALPHPGQLASASPAACDLLWSGATISCAKISWTPHVRCRVPTPRWVECNARANTDARPETWNERLRASSRPCFPSSALNMHRDRAGVIGRRSRPAVRRGP
jgi:hypothetical protein